MPNMASLTVKRADELTNIVYDQQVAASGDKGRAMWRQDTGAPVALPQGMRATVEMATSWNGPKTARRAIVTFKRPYATLNTVTSKYESNDQVVGRLEMVVPQAIPPSEINESVYQFLNLVGLSSGLIKLSIASGYAPT